MDRIVEIIREVPKIEKRQKFVDVPTERVIEKIVEVPKYVDKIVEVPVIQKVEGAGYGKSSLYVGGRRYYYRGAGGTRGVCLLVVSSLEDARGWYHVTHGGVQHGNSCC